MSEIAQRLERQMPAGALSGIEAGFKARANLAIGAGHHNLPGFLPRILQ